MSQWRGRPEGGGHFALWLIRSIGLHAGRRVARLILFPITLYFVLRRGPERRASRAYLTRVFGRRPSFWQLLVHVHYFASTILDRVFLLSGQLQHFDLRVHGLEQLDSQVYRGCGVLLLGAHIGSFEALRVLSQQRPDIRLRVLLDQQQTPAMTELLHALNPEMAASVIHAGQDSTAVVLAMREAAEQGALVGILGDRARGSEATRRVSLFGGDAEFPVAPYQIAAVLKLPLVLAIGLYRGGNRYDLHFEVLHESLRIERRQRDVQLQACAAQFAARLEHYLRIDPYNWFNFYDFWNDKLEAPASDAADTGMQPGKRA